MFDSCESLVLYNNLDEDVAGYGGNMDTLRTHIVVSHDGSHYWSAPVILKGII